MIMLITYRPELREQLNQALQAKGHETAVPAHRQDVMAVLKDCHPHLIVLDMYLSEPRQFDFGELELAIDMCLKRDLQHEPEHSHAVIAKRAC